MDIFGVFSMVGGLALFLYGMSVMGGGLEKMSGGKLERILERLTNSPIKAVLLGAGVTAVCLAIKNKKKPAAEIPYPASAWDTK